MRPSETLLADFADNGVAAIRRVREEDPSTYLRVIAGLLPKELKIETGRDLTDDELDARIWQFAAILGIGVDAAAGPVVMPPKPSARHPVAWPKRTSSDVLGRRPVLRARSGDRERRLLGAKSGLLPPEADLKDGGGREVEPLSALNAACTAFARYAEMLLPPSTTGTPLRVSRPA